MTEARFARKLVERIRIVPEGGTDGVLPGSTLPRRVSKWLRRDLPNRVKSLGVPVTVVTPDRERLQDKVTTGAGGMGTG